MAGSGRRKGGLVLILLALILLVVIGAVAYFFRNQIFPQQSSAAALPTQIPSTNLVKIVVLAQPIARGTAITPEVLATINYPKADLVEGLFYLNTDEVVGKHAKFDLVQGIPLTPSLLTDKEVGSFAAIQIPKNMVAISIPINRLSSVSYSLQPGDHINVIASLLLLDIDTSFQSRLPNKVGEVSTTTKGTGENAAPETNSLTVKVEGGIQGRAELDPSLNQGVYVLPSENQRPRLVSQTLVQDAMVLWVGEYPQGNVDTTKPTPTPAPQAEGQQQAQPAPSRPDIISVVVTPQDAVTLNYLLLSGANLNFVMRSAGDSDKVPTEAVTLQYVLDQYNMPFPAKLPYALEPRMDLLPATMPASSISTGPAQPNQQTTNP
jgi:hypothetical protein